MQAQLHRAAAEVGLTQPEVAAVLGPVHSLPELREEDLELEQACWFHRSWLARALPGAALPNKVPEYRVVLLQPVSLSSTRPMPKVGHVSLLVLLCPMTSQFQGGTALANAADLDWPLCMLGTGRCLCNLDSHFETASPGCSMMHHEHGPAYVCALWCCELWLWHVLHRFHYALVRPNLAAECGS